MMHKIKQGILGKVIILVLAALTITTVAGVNSVVNAGAGMAFKTPHVPKPAPMPAPPPPRLSHPPMPAPATIKPTPTQSAKPLATYKPSPSPKPAPLVKPIRQVPPPPVKNATDSASPSKAAEKRAKPVALKRNAGRVENKKQAPQKSRSVVPDLKKMSPKASQKARAENGAAIQKAESAEAADSTMINKMNANKVLAGKKRDARNLAKKSDANTKTLEARKKDTNKVLARRLQAERKALRRKVVNNRLLVDRKNKIEKARLLRKQRKQKLTLKANFDAQRVKTHKSQSVKNEQNDKINGNPRKIANLVAESGRSWSKTTFDGRAVYKSKNAFDPHFTDSKSGLNNVQLMRKGRAPIGTNGKPIELHHMTQAEVLGFVGKRGAVAEVKSNFHQKNYNAIHIYGRNDPEYVSWRKLYPEQVKQFAAFKRSYWKYRAGDF